VARYEAHLCPSLGDRDALVSQAVSRATVLTGHDPCPLRSATRFDREPSLIVTANIGWRAEKSCNRADGAPFAANAMPAAPRPKSIASRATLAEACVAREVDDRDAEARAWRRPPFAHADIERDEGEG